MSLIVTASASRPTTVPTIWGPYRVLRVVGGVDAAVHARNGLGEAHVPLQATGSDPTGAAGLRAAEPMLG